MKLIVALILAGFGVFQFGCAASPGEWTDAAEREWTLTQLDGKRPLPERTPTLTLAGDGRVAGRSGGNRFFGTYEQPSPGVIQFAALGSTRMRIDNPPGLMAQEQRYLETLGEINAYRVTPERLQLLRDGKTRMVFEPTASATP